MSLQTEGLDQVNITQALLLGRLTSCWSGKKQRRVTSESESMKWRETKDDNVQPCAFAATALRFCRFVVLNILPRSITLSKHRRVHDLLAGLVLRGSVAALRQVSNITRCA